MSHGDDCRIGSSQCDILEITEILMNILVSFFVQPLFHACTFYFGSFYQKFDEIFFKLCYFFGIVLNKFTKPLKKQLHFSFFSCKNRICHHNFKLIAWNNGWIKKEANIFIRISVISWILYWLDPMRQSSPWDIY